MSHVPPHPSRLNILHLEDNPADAELTRALLQENWPACQITRVQTRSTFQDALVAGKFDLILSDFSLPQFDGLSALDIAVRSGSLAPFIFLSGTIGEDNAVEALRRGAIDYVIKDRPARLVPAIRQALDAVREKQRRHDAEQRMLEQAELLDKARDAIVISDMDRKIVYWNQGATRLFGWSANEVLGQRGIDLFGPESLAALKQARDSRDTDEWHGEVKVRSKDGRTIAVESRVTVVRDDRGQPKSHLIISTDITEKKQLEAQFLRAQRLESIGTLAGGIAHDLNNVLTPILMSVNLVQQMTPDPEIHRLMTILENSARHGAGLVRQVLAFARGAEGTRVHLQPKLVIREVVSLLGETLPRSITISTDCASNLALIYADSTQLSQVLMNLGVNARDAMPSGGRLTIRALNVVVGETMAAANPGAKAGPHVLLAVEDTGTGIPPEILDRIFDPFFTTKPQGKGTGLGLATTLGIVKTHGGFIQVRSDVGQGTIFSLYFPASAERPAGGSGGSASEVPAGKGETILVIDDEPAICDIARSLLLLCGYRSFTATDGLQGIALYTQHRAEIRAAVVDMMMPAMHGSEVIRQLHEINPALPVIAMSGFVDERVQASLDSSHATFLAKPVSRQDLARALQRVLKASEP